MISRDVVRKIDGGMKHLIVILMAVIPFAMAWSGPLLVEMGHDHVARWVAQFGLLRGAAWGAMLLGGFIALLNFHLSCLRPLVLHVRKQSDVPFVSGMPMIGTMLLMCSTLPLVPRLWPCYAVTGLILLDTGGPHWFLIALLQHPDLLDDSERK